MTRSVPDIDELRFRCLNNALYHTARRRVLEGCTRWSNFFVIIGGTATVFQLAKSWPAGPVVIGVAITLIGALQLVFDFAGKARTHELLQRRYYDLLGRIEETVKANDTFRASIMGEIARISGEEPPTYRVVEALAYNEATDTLYGEHGGPSKCRITWWQSITRHFFHHSRASFV